MNTFGLKVDGRCTNRAVATMATPLRVARVSKQLNREISEIFVTDKVVRKALMGIYDDLTLDEMATVTEVVVSRDLQVAKVYISLYDVHGKDPSEATWNRLLKLQPYVRKIIGQKVNLRRTPEVRFVLDRDFEYMHKAMIAVESRRLEEEGEILEDPFAARPDQMIDLDEPDDDLPETAAAFADMF